eukprot:4170396-Prorocentrum_lima.AAC.1
MIGVVEGWALRCSQLCGWSVVWVGGARARRECCVLAISMRTRVHPLLHPPSLSRIGVADGWALRSSQLCG